MNDILVPIALFVVVGLATIGRNYFRFLEAKEQQVTVRELLSREQDVSPDVLDALLASLLPQPQADLRRGVIGIFLGIAVVVFGYVLDDPDAQAPLAGLAAFPVLIGIAYLALWKFGQSKS